MKDLMTSAALVLLGAASTYAMPPWDAPQSYEIEKETVTIHTITVPESGVQAHFACMRLIPTN